MSESANVDIETNKAPSPRTDGKKKPIFRHRREANRFPISRLTLTIVMTNMVSLSVLFLGALSLTQYRDGLVASKLEGGRAQAQIIADIMAQVAIDESACTIDEIANAPLQQSISSIVSIVPVETVELPPITNTVIAPVNDVAQLDLSTDGALDTPSCDLSLVTTDVKEVFNRVWGSFEGRVRIFNVPPKTQNSTITDAASLLLEDVMLREDRILQEELPSIETLDRKLTFNNLSSKLDRTIYTLFSKSYRAAASQRTIEHELNEALLASPFADEPGAGSVRINENGELVASVSVPIRKVQAIYGIVTAEIGGIDDLVQEARIAILPLFGFACAAAILSSLLLTAFIARPIRQLAMAADKVREGISVAGRVRIPDFSTRSDEIGELSISLKSMTQTIYARLESIESFAADVSHELKNPLTSIRSASETLDLVKTDDARIKLMDVIKKDVARMDRLITDIANASRLDAELAREVSEVVDLPQLIVEILALYESISKEDDVPLQFLGISSSDGSSNDHFILGNPSALGQVIRNLIDNARSFSPKEGKVNVSLKQDKQNDVYHILVEDEGPGIPENNLESIFKRFYTQRPKGTAFGNNSGLGLAISRQIVDAHGGRVWAENIPSLKAGEPAGARFIVELPMA